VPRTTAPRTVVARGRDTDLVELSLYELTADDPLDLRSDDETLVVVLSGTVDVEIDGERLGSAGGRSSVFESAGHAVYIPPGADARLTSTAAPAELAIASAPLDGQPAGAARIIGPADQRIADVGHDNWARSVRTILGPEHAAGRLLVGETVNPPGNWSSYPPHRHDRDEPPREAQLEEVYLFKVDPPSGFGVQIRYDDDGEQVFTVRENEAAAIKSGFHPVAAAPGYALYYLWVMAGRGREMNLWFDPAHAWVQQPAGG
jgi:5-deoxy-glucuronate isomerase